MPVLSFCLLLALGAIWGGAHSLTRYSVPVFGPVLLVELRIALAAVLLAAVAWTTARPLWIKAQWRQVAVLGVVNTALPFFLLTYAAQSLNASVLSVLNATAPVFGALVGALWLREPLGVRKLLGLVLGIAGVATLVSVDLAQARIPGLLPIAATLGTSLCYGIASNYARRHAARLDHFNSAHGSLWVALAAITPFVPMHPAPGAMAGGALGAVLVLGFVCTGIAYLIYFKLIRDVGPTSALTVAYLIPVFGVLWGVAFLDEPVTPSLIAGAMLVLLGTALTTGFAWGRR